MKKIFCDHCGKEIRPCNQHFKLDGGSAYVIDTSDYSRRENLISSLYGYDLCSSCVDLLRHTLMQFLSGEAKNEDKGN